MKKTIGAVGAAFSLLGVGLSGQARRRGWIG